MHAKKNTTHGRRSIYIILYACEKKTSRSKSYNPTFLRIQESRPCLLYCTFMHVIYCIHHRRRIVAKWEGWDYYNETSSCTHLEDPSCEIISLLWSWGDDNLLYSTLLLYVLYNTNYLFNSSICWNRWMPRTESLAIDRTMAFAKLCTVTGRSTKGNPILLPTIKAPTGP